MARTAKDKTAAKSATQPEQDKIAALEAELATAQSTNQTLIEGNEQLIKANDQLLATIKELEGRGAPQGYVLLPIEPDEGIMLAGSDDQESPWNGDAQCRQIRRRVLEAVVDELLGR